MNLKGLKKGGKIIANIEGFDAKNLRLAAYPEGINPLEDGSLDIVGLEREIDFIMRNSNLGNSPHREMSGTGDYDENIVNING